ncbi:HWE histidine kinase domain-containing protein [Plastoroseomonas hellenica]|nr:HWE histidine kinase domain-containing protein [Plastoroseomonas hellenica]
MTMRPGRADDETTGVGRGDPLVRSPSQLAAENRALKAEVDHLRRVLDSATDYAIVVLDLKGRITGWNAGARAIFGYGHTEVLGRSGDIFLTAEDRSAGVFVAELCRAMEKGRAANERWHIRRDGSRFWASGQVTPLLDSDTSPQGFLIILRDNTTVRADEERRAFLMAEMGHRVRNVLATVQAVAAQTLGNADVSGAVQDTLEKRLCAMARSHDMLVRGGWDGAPLPEIVQGALSPYGGSGHVEASGPPVHLAAGMVEILSLALHELATNAAKHGALSAPEGSVSVCWTLRRTGRDTRLVEIDWLERGGPPVVRPARRGFGMQLLQHALGQGFGGTVELDFCRDGLRCRICLPVGTEEETGSSAAQRTGPAGLHPRTPHAARPNDRPWDPTPSPSD